MRDFIKVIDSDKLVIEIENSIYSKEALLSAAYNYADRANILINKPTEAKYEILFISKGISINDLSQCAKQYCSDIIDQQMRLDVEAKYGNIRDVIVKQAFSQIK